MSEIHNAFIRRRGWIVGLVLAALYMAVTTVALDDHNEVGHFFVGNLDLKAGVPDLQMGYTATDLTPIFEAYGEAGRSDYRRNLFMLDIAMPLLSMLAAMFLLGWFVYKLERRSLHWVLFVPLSALGVDLIENIILFILAGRYPTLNETAIIVGSTVTQIKWTLLYATYFFISIGAVAILGKHVVLKSR